MRFGSAASGIEAASVAWGPLGYQSAWFSEIDPFCCALLGHHYPTVRNLGDMNGITTHALRRCGQIDCLIAGTPCQSYSVAGSRQGLDDLRGQLALRLLNLLEWTQPKWLVWENVPGVLSSNRGRDFGTFLGSLAQLGYGFAYRVLDAQYFGVPQRRRRVFVVGHLGDWRPAATVLFEPESVPGDVATSCGSQQEVAGTITSGSGRRRGCGVNPAEIVATLTQPPYSDREGEETKVVIETVFAYRATGNSGCWNMGDRIDTLTTAKDPNGHILAFGGNNTKGSIDVATACNAKGGSGRSDFESETFLVQSEHSNAMTWNGAAEVARLADVARCLDTTGDYKSSQGGTVVLESRPVQVGVRRLTPLEYERLMGLPDGYTLVPYRKGMAKDGPRYKAIGNSIAIPVLRWIGERIVLVDRG